MVLSVDFRARYPHNHAGHRRNLNHHEHPRSQKRRLTRTIQAPPAGIVNKARRNLNVGEHDINMASALLATPDQSDEAREWLKAYLENAAVSPFGW